MSKLTVREYADIHKVSVQGVYKKIKDNKLECQEIKGTKYIIIDDEINYEKNFNELKVKYDNLQELFEMQKNMIDILKNESKRFYRLLPKPEKLKKKKSKKSKKSKKTKKNK